MTRLLIFNDFVPLGKKHHYLVSLILVVLDGMLESVRDVERVPDHLDANVVFLFLLSFLLGCLF
jgi:hypothetical protein